MKLRGIAPSISGQLDKLMQSTILTEKEWTAFKTLFEQAHPGFFGNLRARYTDLSTAEIRMAAPGKTQPYQ